MTNCRKVNQNPQLHLLVYKPNWYPAILLWIWLLACQPLHAAEKTWTEVKSPHFRVLTDGSSNQARRVAREFEQMRVALSDIMPGLALDPGAPLVVLAPRDEETMKMLSPAMWKQKGAKPAGYFAHGWDKEFAVVRLDAISPESYQVVYHEYVHSIMHLNLRLLPVWLDEGLADFFANTQFESKRLIVGAPNRRMGYLRGIPLIPLETLFAVNHASPYYHDEDKVPVFYAESWALTHYLTFGPDMQMGKKMVQFINLLQQERDQKKAFEQVFGDIKKTQANLDQYVMHPGLPIGSLNNPTHLEEEEFTTRKLTVGETKAELGSFHIWQRDMTDARNETQEALEADPHLGLAHENLGFLNFSQGKDEEALREFTQAVELDGKLYLSLFSAAMLSSDARSDDAKAQAACRERLLKILEMNPRFAPAYVQQARIDVRQGDLMAALAAARKAEQLEPSRAGYHVLTGQILLRMGNGGQAANFAKYVADRWTGPDHDEAVELWDKVPAGSRPAGELSPANGAQGSQIVEGIVKSTFCGGKEAGFNVVLDHSGQTLRFVSRSGFRGGFSDTLWYGEDHFSNCHHVAGLRSVIRYKPSSDASYAGDLTEFDLRDDLPQSATQTKTSPPEAKP